jgi:choline dehydrogenase-like flavoprotein
VIWAAGGKLLSHPVGVMWRASQTAIFDHVTERSVLDVNCKAPEVDNLYAVETSFFPSIGAMSPALTAMANAIRVGDHLLSRMA